MAVQIPAVLENQPVTLLTDYLDVNNKLYNRLKNFILPGGDAPVIAEVWGKLTEDEQRAVIDAITSFGAINPGVCSDDNRGE